MAWMPVSKAQPSLQPQAVECLDAEEGQQMTQRSDDEELGDAAFSLDGEYVGPQTCEDIHMWPYRFEKS